jgi:hypothetical protein
MKDSAMMEMANRHLDGELAGEELVQFEQLLRQDAGLAGYLEKLRAVADEAESLEKLKAPPVDLGSPAAAWPGAFSRSRWSAFSAGMAAAVLLVMLGFGLARYTDKAEVVPAAPASLRLVYFAPDAETVAVMGDFNNWSGAIPLQMKGAGGYWEVELSVAPGEYHYTLILNGREQVTDPSADYVVDDDFGSRNSVIKVGI